jgi:(R)-amidase
MTNLRIALAQICVEEGLHGKNLHRVREIVARHGPSHDLVMFPETCLSGFADVEQVGASAEPLDGSTVAGLQALVSRVRTSVVLGLAERDNSALYNSSILIDPAGPVLAYRKTHLWSSDKGIFQAGSAFRVAPWRALVVGLLICFDIEFPEAARALAALGADLILVVNGNMEPFGPTHLRAVCARAQENQVFVAMVNRVGQGREHRFVGESIVVGPTGEPVAVLDDKEAVVTVSIDSADILRSRAKYRYLDERRFIEQTPDEAPAGGTREVQLRPVAR